MAGALVVVLPAVLARAVFGRPGSSRVGRAAALAVALLMAAILLLTKSRGALLACGVAVPGLLLLRWPRTWPAMLAAAAAAAAGGAWWAGSARIGQALGGAAAGGGFEDRLEIWSRALYMLEDFPITGIGMGAFGRLADLLYPFFLIGPEAGIAHAHNLFLQVGVDLGLPGLLAWLALLLATTACAWGVYRGGRAAGDPERAGLGAGLLACQAALLAHGLMDATTWGTRPAIIVWGLWGLAVAAHRTYAGQMDGRSCEPDGSSLPRQSRTAGHGRP
jgi:putative inorganic carbon (HCO3(-)) transporter